MLQVEPTTIARIGDFVVSSLDDGLFRLDGGAMFGVVPKPLWSKASPADDLNRVVLGLHPLLIDGRGRRILVETGLGNRFDASFAERFDVQRDRDLAASLADAGCGAEDVDVVVNTHLHWDHAGGNFRNGADAGAADFAFPNATHVVQAAEWTDALSPHDRNRSSYRPGDFATLQSGGRTRLVDGDTSLGDGVELELVGGHCRGLQTVHVTSGGETLVFLSDLIPTVAHLEYAWVMGYDLYPVETLRRKKELIARAALERWLLAFYHDPVHRFGHVRIESVRGRERVVFEPLG
jgi:glyoxylase-like metal-dependent hydrolase (beta-lactamase superfamily II)